MNEYYYADLLKSRMLNEEVKLRLIERWIQPWQYKQNRLFGKRLICATTVIGLLAIFAFVGCSKIPPAEAQIHCFRAARIGSPAEQFLVEYNP